MTSDQRSKEISKNNSKTEKGSRNTKYAVNLFYLSYLVIIVALVKVLPEYQ